jgi:hypothetical protein
MGNLRKMPAGIQSFEKLRNDNFIYVDKTAFVYELAQYARPYFLIRPRRFGKSLFVSTLRAYFEGKKELFEGLEISKYEKDWIEYPVFFIDFNIEEYLNVNGLHSVLNATLNDFEKKWGKGEGGESYSIRFRNVIRRAYEKTGKRVVILIDEYDKPLLGPAHDLTNVDDEIRSILKGFYGVIKSSDEYLHFVFITGITKFSRISIFSELNQLVDISLDAKYSNICGISETELTDVFHTDIEVLANQIGKTYDETFEELRKRYNGYHFAKNVEGVYNPFSLLNTFNSGEIRNYWFATGTPTFLVRMLKDMQFNLSTLENSIAIPLHAIYEYRVGNVDPIPILFQAGYLTIKDYDTVFEEYILGYPNEEVRYGFLYGLFSVYLGSSNKAREFFVGHFIRDLLANDAENFMIRLKAFFAGISYELENKTEKHFQTIFYIFFKLMGQFVEVEYCSSVGRSDAVVVTSHNVYIFEFKLSGNDMAQKAIKQIDNKGYTIPFSASNKPIVKIGVEFCVEQRGIKSWVIEE